MTVSPYDFDDYQRPRILISRLSAHGDVVQALPLLSAIKSHWPEAYVGWLVEKAAAPLLENHPLIDRLHICERKSWLKALSTFNQWPNALKNTAKSAWTLRQELRHQRYDLSLDLQGLLKSALWPWLAGIPKRLGYEQGREGSSGLYTHHLPPNLVSDDSMHVVRRYLAFAREMGLPETHPDLITPRYQLPALSQPAVEKIERLLAACPSHRPIIALAPATAWPSKHWHSSHWYSLIQALAQWEVSVVVIGGPGDEALMNQIIPQPQPSNLLNLCAKTELSDLYPLFQRVNILIGLDSAPMHIANAVASHHQHSGKPAQSPNIIAIFGPTANSRTGPMGDAHQSLYAQLDCQPCFERLCPIQTHDCMKQVSPNQVLELLRRMLASQKLFQPAQKSLLTQSPAASSAQQA